MMAILRRSNLVIALGGVLLFHVVSMASGQIAVNDGLGWDGRAYARMVIEGLAEGSPATQLRPLIALATRVPYLLGLNIVDSFALMNRLWAFALYLFVALLLQRAGAGLAVRAAVVANLALCIAASKMFGFYPAQVDLGALALVTAAFYLVATDRTWLAGAACVLAAASREFGVAVALYGIHRTLRRGRPWSEAAAYLPAVATMFIIRGLVTVNVGADEAPITLNEAVQNLQFWSSPAFVTAFVYFTVVLFGGISALLMLRPRWAFARFRAEPELVTYLVVIFGLAAAGNLDIWRYLVFALPAAVLLAGEYCRGLDADLRVRILVAMTLITVLTQQPFQRMNEDLYFRDWFPLYLFLRDAATPDLFVVWGVRVAVLLLIMTAAALTLRPVVQRPIER